MKKLLGFVPKKTGTKIVTPKSCVPEYIVQRLMTCLIFDFWLSTYYTGMPFVLLFCKFKCFQ